MQILTKLYLNIFSFETLNQFTPNVAIRSEYVANLMLLLANQHGPFNNK